MRKNLVLLLTAAMLLSMFVLPSRAQEKAPPQETGNKASVPEGDDDEDPDLPSIPGAVVNKQDFLFKREEQMNFLRGFPYPHPDSRVRAIFAMRRQEIALEQNRTQSTAAATWRAIGPAPIPN